MQVTHLTNAYLKSTFEEVWEKEEKALYYTCSNKFRNKRDLMQNIFKFWQLASGNFIPRSKIGKYFDLGKNPEKVYSAISNQKYKIICLNDNEINKNYEEIKGKIIESFDKILPEKSKFET